jgi:hypothetical protein
MNSENESNGKRWAPKQWLLGLGIFLLVFLTARHISHRPAFQRVSTVFADEISRALGVTSEGPVVLVRIGGSYSKQRLEAILSSAIPTIIDKHRAAVLGIDIDFSRDNFDNLKRNFGEWSQRRPDSAKHVVWAAGYDRLGRVGEASTEPEVCTDCASAGCLRVTPRPVFDDPMADPLSKGIAYAWTDSSGVSRSSFRFVCHSDTTQRLYTFHYKLVESYCEIHPNQPVCERLQQNRQSTATLASWYESEALPLCSVVSCDDGIETPDPELARKLNGKIVILYADIDDNDEHATPVAGNRKGAEIVASLAMNELIYGGFDETRVKVIEVSLEILLAILLFLLFHAPLTERWAMLLSGILFTAFLYFAPAIAAKVPEFRNFALALALAFALEVWFKAVFHDLAGLVKSRQAKTQPEIKAPAAAPNVPESSVT